MISNHESISALEADLDSAEREFIAIVSEIKDIEYQLADHHKTDINGNKMSFTDWGQWRNKALHALRAKMRQQSEIKQRIKDLKEEIKQEHANTRVMDIPRPDALLLNLYLFVREMRNSGRFSLHDTEWRIMDATQDYLKEKHYQ